MVILAATVIVAVVGLSAVTISGYYNLTEVREIRVVAYHNSSGETTYFASTWPQGSLTGVQFHFGRQLIVDAYRTWHGGGMSP